MRHDGFLGEFEQMVLLVVLELGDEAYGARVRDRLQETVGREPSTGALYTTLQRLETKRLLHAEERDGQPERGGRPRRYLRVTDEGLDALQRSRHALLRLWEPVADRLDGRS